jgi:hypothetical protein
MALDGAGYRIYKGEKSELATEEKAPNEDSTALHMSNFLSAVRSRNYKDLNADVQIGVTSADLCHLANISYRVKRLLNFDNASSKFVNDEEANRMLTRVYRSPYVVPETV